MPRKSSIKDLPPEVLAQVNRILTEGVWTLNELVDHLKDAGHPRSRSALGRYKKQLDRVSDRLRRSRDMADALVREIGPGLAEGKTGRMLVEILQNMAFDFMLNQVEDEGDGKAEDLKSQDFYFLAKTIKDLAAASKLTVDQELKIRESVAAEVVKKLDAAAEESERAGERGLSEERVKQLREDFLGIRQAAA